MKPLLSVAFVLLLPMLFCGCCNFAALEGNGACSREQWEAYLPRAVPGMTDQIRIEAEASDVTLFFERGAYAGYKAKVHRGFSWHIPFGPYRERSFWRAGERSGGRSLCIKMDCWGTTVLPFMTGIFTAGDAAVYDSSNGDCLAYERFMRAGIIPLVAYESSVMPVAKGRPMPGCPSAMSPDSLCGVSTSLDGVKQDETGDCYVWPSSVLNQPKYDRLTSYYFLCGLLAFGQKNDRAYMQLVWIPIGLWTLEQ